MSCHHIKQTELLTKNVLSGVRFGSFFPVWATNSHPTGSGVEITTRKKNCASESSLFENSNTLGLKVSTYKVSTDGRHLHKSEACTRQNFNKLKGRRPLREQHCCGWYSMPSYVVLADTRRTVVRLSGCYDILGGLRSTYRRKLFYVGSEHPVFLARAKIKCNIIPVIHSNSCFEVH